MDMQQISFALGDPGLSQALAISSTSAQSAVINSDCAVVTPTVDCFVRHGSNPTATNDGTDLFLLALNTYRLQTTKGFRLAFRTTAASGTVYITPGA